MDWMYSIQDSFKILSELMAQIPTLRKENEPSDVAEPSQIETSKLGFREEVRAQERHLMGAAFQEDRHRQVKMEEEFQERRRRMKRSFPPERRHYIEQEPREERAL